MTPELVGHISPGRHRHRGLGETFGEAEAPKLAPREKDSPRRGEAREPKDVMDAAYDAQPIYAVSRSLGYVPIIDKNGRGREVFPLAPHEAARYKERTVAETLQQPPERRVWGQQRHGAGIPERRAAPDVWRDRPVRRPAGQADQLSGSRLAVIW